MVSSRATSNGSALSSRSSPTCQAAHSVSLPAGRGTLSSWIEHAGLLIRKCIVTQKAFTLLKALVLFTFSQTLKRS